jgi:hypothetical protein
MTANRLHALALADSGQAAALSLESVSVCFGAWLYPAHAAEPHTVEIEAIEVE